jgi:hypothetical protein
MRGNAVNGFHPPATLVADVEDRMVAWAEATGIWSMTMIAQVMEMVRDAGDIADEAPA